MTGRLRRGAMLAAVALAALCFGAGMLRETPRLALLCALAGLAPLAWLWRCLDRLARLPMQAEQPAQPVDLERQRLLDQAMAFEACLEHAPIALFRIDGAGQSASVAPLNGGARKLVAPGRIIDPVDLYGRLGALEGGPRVLLQFETERGMERALVAVSALALDGRVLRLAALMPVESELEAAALDAWRQLVRVLTHEIMNSLTPVASLSRTARELLDEYRAGLPPDVAADLALALDAIGRRADSLAGFVASYRNLSNVPPAQPERVRLDDLFGRLAALVGPDWRARGGAVVFSVEPASLELMGDPGQLEQVLLNLLKNAYEASAEGGQARVEARLVRGARLRIEVADDGAGVPDELVPHIFTPFFTTRKQGSGIGLALVRHLVHANGGTVRYARSVGRGARFVISF